MFHWKLRIGTKLAIASGLGVVLMAGIVINQQWSGSSTQSAIKAALGSRVLPVAARPSGLPCPLKDLPKGEGWS